MPLTPFHFTRQAVGSFSVALALGLAGAAAPASAQQHVSIAGENVNLRAAPSAGAQVLWQLGYGYPLKVLQRKGSWLQVVDFENDKGWVARQLTAGTPHVIVKSPTANLRAGPDTKSRVLGRAAYGDVFQVLDKRTTWIQVQDEGDRKGWIARNLLWGW
ncbi:SH3 domain-containing protein [Ramlibacter tataouinensis]|uniref:SH3 domain-containing protein n=1 Tax=Ramlibacter tataouinensis TaxID=94132 RepID=UPI0022F3BF05|nr:SH3 domain-containing protein [Ramlibacter tataouinensis]WBY02827.1 SH3 domain-containing protein [Ramlibacter tataouinensis]